MAMISSGVEPLARKVIRDSIGMYQSYISPYKGFACPHRVLHNSESCSMYVKRLLGEESLLSAIQLSHQRFKACATASRTLKANATGPGCIVIPCCLPLP